ncbi:hypothetical protein C8F04DRAFT_1174208 [Mycena alexandri]|uniref:Uncharacterized protein n=1 Tax=Mycena alexandri TaxID=1745969 RepID=A0AAD6TEU1_9AGAR|nr:hypothetical protein C8F04DRAFT_1174208 [Mycena alexandri]
MIIGGWKFTERATWTNMVWFLQMESEGDDCDDPKYLISSACQLTTLSIMKSKQDIKLRNYSNRLHAAIAAPKAVTDGEGGDLLIRSEGTGRCWGVFEGRLRKEDRHVDESTTQEDSMGCSMQRGGADMGGLVLAQGVWVTPRPCKYCGRRHRERFDLHHLPTSEFIDVVEGLIRRLGWQVQRVPFAVKGAENSVNDGVD